MHSAYSPSTAKARDEYSNLCLKSSSVYSSFRARPSGGAKQASRARVDAIWNCLYYLLRRFVYPIGSVYVMVVPCNLHSRLLESRPFPHTGCFVVLPLFLLWLTNGPRLVELMENCWAYSGCVSIFFFFFIQFTFCLLAHDSRVEICKRIKPPSP